MPRYEFSEGTSNKFWEIELEGTSFTTRFGKIGTDGQTSTKSFKSAADAKKAYDKIVAEKVNKGYELASGDEEGEDEEGEDEETAEIADEASNPALEAPIHADPTNAQAHQVYGDWLQSKGEPRGELIAVQAALATTPGLPDLKKAEAALFKKYKAKLLGPLAANLKTRDGKAADTLTWRMGFIRSARLAFDYYSNNEEEFDLAALTRTLFLHPSAKFMQELVFGLNREDGDCEYQAVVDVMAEVGSKSLRSLWMADFEYPDENEMSWTKVGNWGALWKALPSLQKVIVQGAEMGFGDIQAPNMRHFEVRTGGLPSEATQSVARAHWPELETLILWTGDDGYGGNTAIDDLEPILEARGLPKLKHLGVMNSQLTDELCKVLARSKVLSQLESLDLSMGTMTDDGRQVILAAKTTFKHLKRLDLSQNLLADTKGLDDLCQEVSLEGQRHEDMDEETDRYVVVSE